MIEIINHNHLKVYIIGIGTDGGYFLTKKINTAITDSGIIVGWNKALSAIRTWLVDKIVFEQDSDNYQAMLVKVAKIARLKQKKVSILILDDPLTYSGGLDNLTEPFKDFNIEIIPGVSSLQLIAAAAKISLEDSVIIVYQPTYNGSIDLDDLKNKRLRMLAAYKAEFNLIILSDLEQNLAQTAEFLIEHGISSQAEIVIGEQIGTCSEQISVASLGEVAKNEYHWMSCMVVTKQLR